jgi:hypothetical protein
MTEPAPPPRQVRAVWDETSIVVYQAYPPEIADAALTAGTFVPPFKRERMTWIKPSFRWMMYRCGYATKPGQTRVLAVRMSRDGFEWALANAALSHYDRGVYPSAELWSRVRDSSPVRVQWDPERSLRMGPLDHRSIQVGLGGEAVDRYVDEWVMEIVDITNFVHEIGGLVRGAHPDIVEAARRLPPERPYPLPGAIAARVGAT